MNSAENTNKDTTDFSVGSVVFEKFEILSFISSGAKGRVYKARDRMLNNVVALKVLITDSRSDKDLIRFQSEARIASKLNHPGIAAIYDFGLFGSIPFLSMEFVEGESLQSVLKQHQTLSISEFLDVFIQVSTALVHAHKHGVVHRDIKPANIVIKDNGDGTISAKVLDFGIAKKIDLLVEEHGKLTPTGDIVGSPFYMSPEQTRGQEVTPKSDNYSLGCVMWEALSGTPPLSAETAMETLLLHQTTVPENLSNCVSEELPAELTNMISNMLSKQPDKRPDLSDVVIPLLQSIQENEIEESEPVELIDPEQPTETVKAGSTTTSSRKRIYVLLGLVGCMLLIILVVQVAAFFRVENIGPTSHHELPNDFVYEIERNAAALRQTTKKNVKMGQVDLKFGLGYTDKDIIDLAGQTTVKSINLSDSLITSKCLPTLAKFPNLRSLNLHRTGVTTLENIDKLKQLEILDLKGTRISEASLDNLVGLKRLVSLKLSRVPLTDAALTRIARISPLEELDLSETPLTFESIEELKKLKNLKRLNLRDTNINDEAARKILVMPQLEFVDLTDCNNISNQARLAREYLTVGFAPNRAMVTELTESADNAMAVRNTELAMRKYAEVAGLLEKRLGDQDVRLLPYYLNLGSLNVQIGNLAQARVWFEKAQPIAERNGDPISVADGLNQVAYYQAGAKMTPDVESRLLETNRIAAQCYGAKSPKIGTRLINLGDFYTRAGDHTKALPVYEKAVALLQLPGSSPESPYATELARAQLHLGEGLRELNRFQQAQVHYKAGINILEKTPNLNPVYIGTLAKAIAGQALIAMADKDYDRALALNSKGLEFVDRSPGTAPWKSMLFKQRAKILRLRGRKAEALEAEKNSKANR